MKKNIYKSIPQSEADRFAERCKAILENVPLTLNIIDDLKGNKRRVINDKSN